MSAAPRLRALAGLFFISGACGLIYQVLWLRLLGLVFGVTVYSASAVWASFMSGLALGSILGGRVGDRVKSPLRWFGAVEILVGITALATPAALGALQQLHTAIWPSLPQTQTAATIARFLMAFIVLIVPTLLMGATLPLVVRSAMVRRGELGSRVGVLYGTNTAGAIIGTLAAGLFLIPGLGITNTFRTAAALNIAIGLAALLLSRSDAPGVERPDPIARTRPGRLEISKGTRRLVLAVFVLSGFATLALEVIWFRSIVLVARPTVYTFAVMLATVLGGIAAGSYLIALVMRRAWNWLATLAVLELAMAVAAVASLGMLAYVNQINDWLIRMAPPGLPVQWSLPVAAALPVILPAGLLMGMAFPIGVRLWVGADEQADAQTASRLGLFTSLNLVGAIVGSLTAGFLLLPAFGSRTSLLIVSVLIFLSGLALAVAAAKRTATRAVLALALVPAFALVASRSADPFDVFLKVRYPGVPIAWREEAVQGTVSVHGDRPGTYMLVMDGNHQANDTGAMVDVHRRIGHLAMAIHPEARQVLVVGLGGGATAGAASVHDGAEIDVVELSAAVVRASSFFKAANHDLLSRPNVTLRVDDGRNYLALTRKKYDVITADIIQPVHAGSNNVYSREYFELVRAALQPGGLAMQWIWGTEAEYKTIARTFQTVFPHTTVWFDGSLFVGSIEPLVLREADFTWKLSIPGRRQGLEEIGLRSFADLLKLYRAGPEELRAFVGDGPILTDDRPLAEYFLSLPRDKPANVSGLTGDVRRHLR